MRQPCYGKVFWGNQIKGKKGRAQRPLKEADSSPDMRLKRDAAADAKKGGKGQKREREWKEAKDGKKEKDGLKARAKKSENTDLNSKKEQSSRRKRPTWVHD